jgi:hypothetical protein
MQIRIRVDRWQIFSGVLLRSPDSQMGTAILGASSTRSKTGNVVSETRSAGSTETLNQA